MPKKRNYNFKQLQGKSSSSIAGSSNRNSDTNSPSVNERLSELRKLEAKDAAAKKRELADSANKRSVPPSVQGILGVPESAPPKPKAGVRTRERLRTPGPAPPKSWLTSSSPWTPAMALRGARRGLKTSANQTERRRPRELLHFARSCGLESVPTDGATRTLTHITLKAIAESWDLFEEEDYPAFADIPLRLRLRILSYIGFYGPIVNASGLQALLQGAETLDQLDLGGLVGHGNLVLKRVEKLLTKIDGEESHKPNQPMLESWDVDESLEQSLRPSLRLNRASQLTHLCLSHPGPGISWRDLLTFSKTTPRLTHLSLAYWPWPTLTPNLATTMMVAQHGPSVTAGGASYYAAMDQDIAEPTLVLRQLSSNLLCLKWLDIEGCQQWAPALAELADDWEADDVPGIRRSANDVWTRQKSEEIPALASYWKNLNFIRCAQGWLPIYWGMRMLLQAGTDTSGIEELLGRSFLNHLEDPAGAPVSPPKDFNQDMIDVEKKRARLWLQSEVRMTVACMKIEVARRRYKCKAINVDYGWPTKPKRP